MALFDDLRLLLDGERLTPQRVCEVLAEHYGGTRIYVPRRCDPPLQVTQRDTPKSLMERGVRRSTAYNWVRRWRP